MNDSSPKWLEATGLVDDFCDGTLDEAKLRRLEHLLATDDEVLAYYVRTVDLMAELQLGLPEKLGAAETLVGDQGASESLLAELTAKEQLSAPRNEAKGARSGQYLWSQRPVSFWSLVTVLTLLVWSSFFVATSIWWYRMLRDQQIAQQEPATPVARVIETVDAVWEADAMAWQHGARLAAGRQLLLKSGFVELAFEEGARVILEGRAHFTIKSRGAGELHVGKLTAIVPQPAIGFEVRTETANIVDLGTEFGVVVSDNKNTDVHVLVGSVAVESRGPAAQSKPKLVLAGESVRVRLQQPVEVLTSKQPEFARNLNLPGKDSVLLDDQFDDGRVTENSRGIGGGFDSFTQVGASLEERSGVLVMKTTESAIASVVSQEDLTFFNDHGMLVQWTLRLAEGTPNRQCIELGVWSAAQPFSNSHNAHQPRWHQFPAGEFNVPAITIEIMANSGVSYGLVRVQRPEPIAQGSNADTVLASFRLAEWAGERTTEPLQVRALCSAHGYLLTLNSPVSDVVGISASQSGKFAIRGAWGNEIPLFTAADWKEGGRVTLATQAELQREAAPSLNQLHIERVWVRDLSPKPVSVPAAATSPPVDAQP